MDVHYDHIKGVRFHILFLLQYFMDVRYNLINGVSWSQGVKRRILKLKRAPKLEKKDFTNFRVI
ncbi:hypothetical protein H5410_056101 [Solanum commersonii]|uniref:Uncharacterized protein n=1 Tax=Solanum commersonii TaxID=4109 RepID=A0A9J5WL46_SOLCO|nr:hypothetical protein H5410_056101 [Solanum commersonii]